MALFVRIGPLLAVRWIAYFDIERQSVGDRLFNQKRHPPHFEIHPQWFGKAIFVFAIAAVRDRNANPQTRMLLAGLLLVKRMQQTVEQKT
jgi:hypothetical protein